jgi:hypothetical protein
MEQVFDIIEAINEKSREYFYARSQKPVMLSVSPGSYRRLIEIRAAEGRIGNLIIGCSALEEVVTAVGKLKVVIDEMLQDTAIQIA